MLNLLYVFVVLVVIFFLVVFYRYYSARYKIIRYKSEITIQSRTKNLIKTIHIDSDTNYTDVQLSPFMKRFDSYIKDNINIECDILYITSRFVDLSLSNISLAITIVGKDGRDREVYISFEDISEVKPFLDSIEFNMVLAALSTSSHINKHLGDYEDWVEFLSKN